MTSGAGGSLPRVRVFGMSLIALLPGAAAGAADVAAADPGAFAAVAALEREVFADVAAAEPGFVAEVALAWVVVLRAPVPPAVPPLFEAVGFFAAFVPTALFPEAGVPALFPAAGVLVLFAAPGGLVFVEEPGVLVAGEDAAAPGAALGTAGADAALPAFALAVAGTAG